MANEDSDSEQELFPIDVQEYAVTFLYDDPLLVSGVLRAVVEGDLDKVKTLILGGKSANINDNHGNTPLHVAVIKNLSNIVDYLLTLEAVAVNSRNFYGETALFMAVKRGFSDMAEKLVKANANVNLPNFEDVTPLHISVRYPEIALSLVQNGAKIDAKDYSGETPLHEAVNEKCMETVCMLLHYNADANVECDNNITPFMKSIIIENIELQEILLNYVVDFNTATKEGMTILNLALTHTCPYVKDIIDSGADINYEHKILNSFLMCLQVPNVNNFNLIWKDFKYQKVFSEMSYLEMLIHNLDNNDIYDYLRVIINSNNLEPIFVEFDFFPFYVFILERVHNKQPWLQIASDIICLYVCQGYTLDSYIISALYQLFGYNELLYICLHMDLQETRQLDLNLAKILYDTTLTVNNFKIMVSKWIHNNRTPVEPFLPYISILETSNMCTEECKNEHERLCQFPSLLEISRNATRDYLVHKFSLYTSKRYYLFVQNLPIPTVYRDILMFKKPVYTIKL